MCKVWVRPLDCPRCGKTLDVGLGQIIAGQKRVEARCHKKDRYGREVCAVFVSLREVGLEQIRAGMAWHYKESLRPARERRV